MSKILEEMRSQYIQSMKNKDNLRKKLLSTLIGMIEQEKKPNIDLTDNMVLDKINSFKKKAIELIQIYEVKLVAEGIETEFQATLVQSLPVERVQGYYFHRPQKLYD